MQLDHLNLYVSDLDRSRRFYTALLPGQGLTLNREIGDVAVGFGRADYAELALVVTPDPIQPIHLAFRMDARDAVDHVYAAALAAGAIDNGEPGVRAHYHPHYYAAFVFDPDGHNLEFVCHHPPFTD